MSPWINQVTCDILEVLNDFQQKFPAYTLRLACVAYRDWSDGNKRIERFHFSENVQEFQDWIGKLIVEGGDDVAEDVFGGLLATANLDWSSSSSKRILFHIV